MWIAHRGIGDSVIGGVQRVAEYGVGDPPKCIGTAKPFFGRVKTAMPIVECRRQQAVEYLLELFTELIMALRISVAQDFLSETTEFQRVVVSEGHAHAQRLTEASAAQSGNGGCQRVQGGATVDTHGLALVAQFAGVTGGATDIEKVLSALAVLMAGKTHGQVARIECARLLLRIGEKTEAGEVIETSELFSPEWHLQGAEPVVAQSLNRGALRCVVIGLALLVAPL